MRIRFLRMLGTLGRLKKKESATAPSANSYCGGRYCRMCLMMSMHVLHVRIGSPYCPEPLSEKAEAFLRAHGHPPISPLTKAKVLNQANGKIKIFP